MKIKKGWYKKENSENIYGFMYNFNIKKDYDYKTITIWNDGIYIDDIELGQFYQQLFFIDESFHKGLIKIIFMNNNIISKINYKVIELYERENK